ncbi:MAG: galactokinase [Sporichthyaceae bacterium]|nr:galactokinase [Sporichthyaceae bacterium]
MRIRDTRVASFGAVFGREPAVVASAPGRVNLIGEHTDYNDGFVLPFAIPQRTRVQLAGRDDDVVRLATSREPGLVQLRLGELEPRATTSWSSYPAGVLWALAEAGHPVRGVDLLVDGDVPAGAGLSSSAALETATALALDQLWQLGLDRVELARLARAAENRFVGIPCGIMDQMAALLCAAGHALLLDTRSLTHRQLPLDLTEAGLTVLVVDSGVRHELRSSEYGLRLASCRRAAAKLGLDALRDLDEASLTAALDRLTDPVDQRRVRHVVTENARVLAVADRLEAGQLRAIGPLLTSSHESLRDDYQVACPELDTAVDSAVAAGALGARLTGAGFGGSAIALVEQSNAEAVAAAVRSGFAAAGFGSPWIYPVVASAGAAVER